MNKILNEVKTGWNEVRWIGFFSIYLLPTTAFAVLISFLIDGKFSTPPSLMQILLAVLAGLLSLYFSIQHSTKTFENKKESLSQFSETKSGSTISINEAITLPKFGTYVLLLLTPKEIREPMLGDLSERYNDMYQKFGENKAKMLFYFDVMSSIKPFLLMHLIKFFFLANIVEIIRKLVVFIK